MADLVYVPLETDLLRAARRRGHPVVDGLGMLIHQAVPGFRHWGGVEPTVDATARGVLLAVLPADATPATSGSEKGRRAGVAVVGVRAVLFLLGRR